jgi:hypothetical protein
MKEEVQVEQIIDDGKNDDNQDEGKDVKEKKTKVRKLTKAELKK